MKKLGKIVAGLATVITIGMTGVPALASTGEEAHSGMVVDQSSTNSLSSRTTQKRDGGTWNYGVGSTYVWSYYLHKHKVHKVSVRPGYFEGIVTSGWVAPGIQARVSARRAQFGNAMYYDIKN